MINELKHYGVKGQKWGVVKDDEYVKKGRVRRPLNDQKSSGTMGRFGTPGASGRKRRFTEGNGSFGKKEKVNGRVGRNGRRQADLVLAKERALEKQKEGAVSRELQKAGFDSKTAQWIVDELVWNVDGILSGKTDEFGKWDVGRITEYFISEYEMKPTDAKKAVHVALSYLKNFRNKMFNNKMGNRVSGGHELKHHGILGQKWGVRRYRNKDGSLTTAGKKRYGLYNKKEKRDYSDDELTSMIKRLELEKKYTDLLKNSQNLESGKKDVTEFLKKYGAVIGAAAGTVGLLIKIKEYQNKSGAQHSDINSNTNNNSNNSKKVNSHSFSSLYKKIKDKSLDEVVDEAFTNNMDGILDAIEDGLS